MAKPRKILGVDPGYDRLGIAIIEKWPPRKEMVIYSECFQTPKDADIHDRLALVGNEITKVLDEFRPDCTAIENLFITKNQKTAMRVAEVRGIVIYESMKRGIPVSEYTPMQIKTAITGDGTSDKTRVMKMVDILIDVPDKKKTVGSRGIDDEYDAIAVALTHLAIFR